jgi:hypothetical protein
MTIVDVPLPLLTKRKAWATTIRHLKERTMKDARFTTTNLKSLVALSCALLTGTSIWAATANNQAASNQKQFTTDFRIEDCTFSDRGRNAYFSLNPGDHSLLSDGSETVEITVLNSTRKIDFTTAKGKKLSVNTRVVEELHTENGAVVERSRNFFARCRETNDIFYFGERVIPASVGGAWLAGNDGAQPGIIMPGTFLLGARYFQEIAPEVALDRAENVRMGLTITVHTVPRKTFKNCVEVVETTPLEPGTQSVKRYCPGVGLVFDSGLKLIEFQVAKDDKETGE